MPLQFDATRYVPLVEVFERTGQAVFPQEWCGLEAWSAPAGGMATIAAERKNLQAELSRLGAELAPLRARFTFDLPDVELQVLQDEIFHLDKAFGDHARQLKALPTVQPFQIEDEDRFKRRRTVEDALRAALTGTALRLLYGPFQTVDWKGWADTPGFSVNFRLGVIRAPRSLSAKRWAPGFVEKAGFESWLAHITRGDADTLPAEEWIKQQVNLRRDAPPKKAVFLAELRDRFPNLSFRGAGELWSRHVPDGWKKPGPKG
jgi:hypothetical protein